MQTIYLDISNKGVVPTIYAKQGDVGRKFEVVFTDSGIPYSIPTNAKISIWYEGDSGVGNYTDIGENSAIAIGENKAVVELITQMLSEDGEGIVCLVMNAGNNQIGSWNIRYLCERVPGFDSEGAKEYYTAFSKTVESLKQVTENLTPEAIGAAPDGYGYGDTQRITFWNDTDGTLFENYLDGFFSDAKKLEKVYRFSIVDYPACLVTGQGGFADVMCSDMLDGTPRNILIVFYGLQDGVAIATKKKHSGVWYPWEYVNPPMTPGIEYRTTERWNGKAVYAYALSLGTLPNASIKDVTHGIANIREVISCTGTTSDGRTMPFYGPFTKIYISAIKTAVCVCTETDESAMTGTATIKYTKTTD